MRTIWKFPLKVTSEQIIEAPPPFNVLSVAEQGGILCLWAMVDPQGMKQQWRIIIKGTGHTFPTGEVTTEIFVGTVLTSGMELVWHVFAKRA